MGNACCSLLGFRGTTDEPWRQGDDVPATSELDRRNKMAEMTSEEELDEKIGRWEVHVYAMRV